MPNHIVPEIAIKTLDMLSKSDNPDHLVLETIMRTGARSCELVGVTEKDINPTNGYVFIRAAKGSNNHQAHVAPNFAKRLLEHIKRYGHLLGHCCNSTNRNSLTAAFRKVIGRNRRLFGEDISLHSLRATFAVLQYLEHGDIMLVQQLLGHKSISSTMHYVRISLLHRKRKQVLRALK